MTLTFLGNTYTTSTQTLKTTQIQKKGVFLGQPYTITQTNATQLDQPEDLTYRGIQYKNRRPNEVVVNSRLAMQKLRLRSSKRHHAFL